jgi:diguanylate cyclase (GGDEF)-like protein
MPLALACKLALAREESSRFEPVLLLCEAGPRIIECADILRVQADVLERTLLEKDALVKETARAAAELKSALREQHALAKRLRDAKSLAEYDATHDALTGLLNHKGFFAELAEIMSAIHGAPPTDYGLLFLDLDRFKPINDSLGHQAGNDLLIQVALRLATIATACNAGNDAELTEPYCIVGRHSGDEFVLACAHQGDEAAVQRTALLVHKALTAPYDLGGMSVSIGVSIGLVASLKSYPNVDLAVRDADIAMYTAKRESGSKIAGFKPRMHTVVEKRLLMETELRNAVKCGELRLHYQPIIATASSTPFAYEGLLRWNGRLGLLYPGQFIPVAEETGLINEIGLWTLQAACTMLKHSPMLRGTDIRICLNISAVQLESSNLPARFAAICADFGICPSRIILELTERSAMTNPDHVARILRQFKEHKFGLALDDFGTGHSSLSWLHHFPVDILKLDRSFFAEIEKSVSARKMADGILGLCRSLGIIAIAEGVERQTQADCLADHFGHPDADLQIAPGPALAQMPEVSVV